MREKARARERDKRKKRERRGNRKGENELQGFYRKLQRDNSSLVPINFMALMIPTERHKSHVEINKSVSCLLKKTIVANS